MNGKRYGDQQILRPETAAAMQKMQTSTDGSPLGFGLSWEIGKDDFGNTVGHDGGGATIETVMRFHPEMNLGVAVMSNFNGSQAGKVADGMVSAWMSEK